MKKQKVVILNITHGDHPYMDKSPFLPIATGACRNDILNDACGDDNISCKNKWYGDFTSIYWAWKNLKNVDIIGTSHYRRYLSNRESEYKISYITWKDFCKSNYSVSIFEKALKEYDFLMPYPMDLKGDSIYEQYHMISLSLFDLFH